MNQKKKKMLNEQHPKIDKDFALTVIPKGTTAEDVEYALRRLRKRMEKVGLMDELFRRQYYLKPCLAKRVKRKSKKQKINKAYVQDTAEH